MPSLHFNVKLRSPSPSLTHDRTSPLQQGASRHHIQCFAPPFTLVLPALKLVESGLFLATHAKDSSALNPFDRDLHSPLITRNVFPMDISPASCKRRSLALLPQDSSLHLCVSGVFALLIFFVLAVVYATLLLTFSSTTIDVSRCSSLFSITIWFSLG